MPPPLPEIRYFVDEAGIAGGPYVIAELQARVASGALRPETRVWTAGMPAWAPASSVAALAPLLAAAPPPPPAAPAFDIERFIVGHWQQEGPVTMHGGAHGTHRTTFEFKADRSWAVYGNSNMSSHLGTFQTVLTGQGTYTLNPAPGSQFELRMDGMFSNDIVGFAHDGSTSEYKTAIRLSIVDQNTIRSEDGTISRRIGP